MIRKVAKKDFPRIYELGKLLHENYENLYNLEELTKKEYFKTLVAEESKNIVGFLMYTDLDGMIDIMDIVVDNSYRRQKIGSLLMDEMITNSKEDSKFYLEVNVKNEPAIQMYEKFGFKRIHTRKKYYGEEDALIMERTNENE